MEAKGLITKSEALHGRRRVTIYRATETGLAFCKRILEPYEAMFPRIKKGI
jgi:DNA-binding PadR family transcriptional regulator